MDHFSRRVLGFAIFTDKPTSKAIRVFLGRSISRAKATPKYLICDHGSQFDCDAFKAWCHRKGIKPRFGALGKHGRIAVIERMIQTLKNEGTRRILVPLKRTGFRREVSLFIDWFIESRREMSFADCSPNEV